MTPMNKKALVRLAILALVGAVGFLVLVFTAPEPPVSKRNFARIDGIMTEADLTAFLGPAHGDETILAKRAYDSDVLSFGVDGGTYGKTWQGHGEGIHVTFGEDGMVREAIYIRYERGENLLAKLKRWIRLS
jgi:hypothetical protein